MNSMEEQNNQQSQEEAIQQIYKYAANLLFEQKKSDEETKECLIKSGLTPEDADYVINELNNYYKQEERKAGKKNMLYGALWCIGGIIVTVMTYQAAAGGGTYVVAWGAILYGGIQFIKGVSQML